MNVRVVHRRVFARWEFNKSLPVSVASERSLGLMTPHAVSGGKTTPNPQGPRTLRCARVQDGKLGARALLYIVCRAIFPARE